MPDDKTASLLRMGHALLLVAAVAVPLAVGCAVFLRRRCQSLCPPWRVPGPVLSGFVMLALFAANWIGQDVTRMAFEATGFYQWVYGPDFPLLWFRVGNATVIDTDPVRSTLRVLWAQVGFVPPFLAAAIVLRAAVLGNANRRTDTPGAIPRNVMLSAGCWVTFGLAALVVNTAAQWIMEAAGQKPTPHPLTLLGPTGDGVGGVLFALSACVTAPLVEEYLFRGLLVPWASGRRHRPWLLVVAAVALILMQVRNVTELPKQIGPLVFVGVVAALMWLVARYGRRVWRRLPRRTVAAVWSSSIMFAAAHSSVWPTPISLFVLALGLGWLTARTRRWWPSAVAHGLFNAASFLFVVLGG